MTRYITRVALAMGLAAVTACSSQPDTDKKVAELEKQLETARQELAARTGEAGAAAETATQTAAQAQSAASSAAQAASAAASQSAETREAAERAAQAAADQSSRDRAATEQALSEQRAATAKQAAENQRLRAELEAMKPRELTLPAGTIIPVRTTAAISTKTMTTGATFDALLEHDVVVDGTLIARAGSPVVCVVSSADPGGKVKGVASLSVRARSITAVDGQPVIIKTGSFSTQANSTVKKDVTRTGIATGAGAVIGAIAGGGKGAAIGAGVGAAGGAGAAMATRGDPAVIPSEALIEFALTSPATVVLKKQG